MARAPRTEEIRTERRRRDDGTISRAYHLKLAIPAEFRDDQIHEYRWANDVNSRIQELHDMDWDVVKSRDSGAEFRKPVDVQKGTGQPIHAVLMRKRKDWCDEDRLKAARARSNGEDAMLKAPAIDPANPQAADSVYVAKASITRRGAYAP